MIGYAAPTYIDEVVTLLTNDPSARVLAGGHSLLVEPNRSRIADVLLVDLRRIPGLAGIDRQREGSLKIGAMTTLASLAANEAIREAYPALTDAVRTTGDAQLRNRATVGGSLAGSDPEDDLPALMLALDATVHVMGPQGTRTLSADVLLTGPYQTSLAPGEVIVAITIPAPAKRSGVAFEKFRHPATLYTICGVGVQITAADNGGVGAIRAAVAGAAEQATRLTGLEKMLAGRQPGDALISAAAESALGGLTFRGDLFASPEYRRHLTRVLAERAVKQAFARAAA